jgi:hypothetical protein
VVAVDRREAGGRGAGPLSTRASRWVVLSAWALSLALIVLGILLTVANRSVENDIAPYTVNLVVAALAFSAVGVLVASRRRENPVGWLLLGTGVLYATELFAGNYSVYTLATDPGSLPGASVAAWLTAWVWISGGSLVLFIFLFFPDGKLPSVRWRPVAWLVLVNAVLSVASVAFAPGPLEGFYEGAPVTNPVGIQGSERLLDLGARVTIVLLIPISISLILAFIMRFRRAHGEERQQIKWVAYGVAVFAFALIVVSVWPALDGSTVGSVLFLAGFAAIPSAMALAILKYHLYDIDVVINRTLVYALLTAALVLVYVGCVVGLQSVFRIVTGQETQLVVVASTLVIAVLFNPLRWRIQDFIDRIFYRRKYDAAKTLETFGYRLREETNLDQLGDDVVAVVRETLQPSHVSLWLRTSDHLTGGKGAGHE